MDDDLRREMGYAAEYDYAARWCALRGFRGKDGDPLPELLSVKTCDDIAADVPAFMARVAKFAYAECMKQINPPEDPEESKAPPVPEWGPRYGPHRF